MGNEASVARSRSTPQINGANEKIDVLEATYQKNLEQPQRTVSVPAKAAPSCADLLKANEEQSRACPKAKKKHQENSAWEHLHNPHATDASAQLPLGDMGGRTQSESVIVSSGCNGDLLSAIKSPIVTEFRLDRAFSGPSLEHGQLATKKFRSSFGHRSLPDMICGEILTRSSMQFRSLPSISRSPTALVDGEINTLGENSKTLDMDKLTRVFSASSRDAAAKENLHSLLFSPETYNESELSRDNSKIFSYGETEDDVFLPSTTYSITGNEEITKDDSKIIRGENEQASIKDEVESTEWPLKSAEIKLPHIVVLEDTDTLRSVPPMPRSEIVPDDYSQEENSSADTRFFKKPPLFSREPCGKTDSGKRVARPKEEQVKDEIGEDQANNEQKAKNTTKHVEEPLLLDQNITESQNQQTDLVKETSMVTTELTLSGQSNSKLKNENMALNLQIQELKQELAAAKDELRAMKGRLERSELRATNLKKQLQTEESRRKSGALKQKQVLLNKALEAKEEAEQAKQKQLSLEAQRLRLENQLKEVTARASMAEHDRQVIDRQHSRLRTMSVDLQKELDSTHQARQEALNSTRQLEHRLQLSEKQRAESIEALDKATKESRKMRRDRDNVQEELKQLQKTKSELVLQNLKLSEDLAEQKSDLSDMQLALNEKREREKLLMARLEDVELKLRAEKMKTERLEANTKSLEKTIKDLRDNLSAMSKESPPQQQKMIEMEQLLSLVREQLRSEQEKSQAAAREARAQGRQVRECTMLLEQKKIAAVQLQGKFDKLEAAHERLKHERETMEDEISRLRIQKRAFSRDLETLTEKIYLLEQERESLRHKLNYQQESTWPELSGGPVSSTPPDVTSAA